LGKWTSRGSATATASNEQMLNRRGRTRERVVNSGDNSAKVLDAHFFALKSD
jgi:hypothetical protein